MLKDVASLWIGTRLGEVELASIRSFRRQGHDYTLFAYEPLENCPDDVTVRDAREIYDCGRIMRHHKTGSPTLHSDIFRYAMIRETDFVWVDLDVIALRPFDFPSDYIFGYEDHQTVNNAVLKLPHGSPALEGLCAIDHTTTGCPPHLSGLRKRKYQLRDFLAGGLSISRWPWGSIGPKLLTRELQASGEISHARPTSAFYSLSLSELGRVADPDGYHVSDAPPDAWSLHLWSSGLKRYVDKNFGGDFPKTSFVSKVLNDDW